MCAASSPTTDISIEISVECLLSELSETEKRSDVDFCCCGMSFGRFVASRSADVRSLFGGNIKCCSKIAQSKCYLRYLHASKPEVQALKSSTVCFFFVVDFNFIFCFGRKYFRWIRKKALVLGFQYAFLAWMLKQNQTRESIMDHDCHVPASSTVNASIDTRIWYNSIELKSNRRRQHWIHNQFYRPEQCHDTLIWHQIKLNKSILHLLSPSNLTT